MKKVLSIILAISLYAPVSCFAANLSGVVTNGKGKIGFDADYDYVFERKLQGRKPWTYRTLAWIQAVANTSTTTGENTIRRNKTKIKRMNSVLIKPSYGILDNVDIYATLGTTDLEMTQAYEGPASWANPGIGNGVVSVQDGRIEYGTDNSFTCGGGLRANYTFAENWLVGLDAQYLFKKFDYDASATWVVSNEPLGANRYYEGYDGTFNIHEYDIAAYIGYNINGLVPYAGVKYSDLFINEKSQSGYDYMYSGTYGDMPDMGSESFKALYKSSNIIGLFAGLNYVYKDTFKLNIEGRFLDETGISGTLGYKF